MSPVMINDL